MSESIGQQLSDTWKVHDEKDLLKTFQIKQFNKSRQDAPFKERDLVYYDLT